MRCGSPVGSELAPTEAAAETQAQPGVSAERGSVLKPTLRSNRHRAKINAAPRGAQEESFA